MLFKNSIYTICFLVCICFLLISATCKPPACQSEAHIYVGLNVDKPAPGKTAFICPGESVGIAWTTKNAQSASIDPDFGQVALEGLETVTPASNTTYILKTSGGSCIDDEDAVHINVVNEGDKYDIQLNRPPKDKDTGFPVNLIWNTAIEEAFVSQNILVTKAELVSLPQSCNWDKWLYKKTDTDGTVQPQFQITFPDITNLVAPFKAPGNYDGTPVELPEGTAVAIAECDVLTSLTLKCK